MEKIDWTIIVLFIFIVASLYLVLDLIKQFMPVLATCEDDFEVIKQCNCVPCNWKDAMKYNVNFSCMFENFTHGR